MSTSVIICFWLSLFSSLVNGIPDTTSAPSFEGQLLQELQRMNQKLDSMQQAMQPSYSVVGSGSGVDLMTNKLQALEIKWETTQTALAVTQTKLEATEAKLEAANAKLEVKLEAVNKKLKAADTKQEATDTALQSTRMLFQSKLESGSTFVRWGRKTCTNSSQVVYTGVAGGSWYDHTGAAVDLLCLTTAPEFDATPVPGEYARLYGAEYQLPNPHYQHDVPCSVCRAAQSTTIMIPATHVCPLGWTTQYTGHLVAGGAGHKAASQYNCLDGHPQHSSKGQKNENGRLLHYTVTQCGSLPCPPYIGNKIVLCVVCSK